MNTTLTFVCLTAVYVKKEFLLNILTVCFRPFNPENKTHAPYYISIFGFPPSAVSFTLFHLRQCFRIKNRECAS